VITIPVGVLKSHRVRFVPDLPKEKMKALEKLTMGPVTKMIYCFDEPVAPPGIMAIYSSSNPPMWWSPSFGRNDTKFHVWSAFFAGSWARELLALPAEEALARGLETLRAEVGKPHLTPVRQKLVNWLGDPYAMGGYTVCLPGGFSARDVLGKPTPPLYWAGEATGVSGTVHASFDTGERAAEEIMRSLRIERKPPSRLGRFYPGFLPLKNFPVRIPARLIKPPDKTH
jgi:monoamine oxidase